MDIHSIEFRKLIMNKSEFFRNTSRKDALTLLFNKKRLKLQKSDEKFKYPDNLLENLVKIINFFIKKSFL